MERSTTSAATKTALLSSAAYASSAALAANDPPVPAKVAAPAAGLSISAFWRAVADGRLPAPVYPAPRAPRWFVSEIRAALAATRALPAEAKAGRRLAKLAEAQESRRAAKPAPAHEAP